MARTARLFAPLDVNYFDDDRVLAAGPDAVLHIAAILQSKKMLSDGELSRRQLARIAPESVGDVARSIEHLIEVGLFIAKGDSITIHAWANWNASTEDVEAMAQGGEYGNHLRWHARRNTPNPQCKFCRDRGESVGDIGGESPPESQRQSRDRDRSETLKAATADFATIYSTWPKQKDEAKGLAAYKALRGQGIDHTTLQRAAAAYLAEAGSRDAQYVKSLASFFSGIRGPWSEYLKAELERKPSCGGCGVSGTSRCPLPASQPCARGDHEA